MAIVISVLQAMLCKYCSPAVFWRWERTLSWLMRKSRISQFNSFRASGYIVFNPNLEVVYLNYIFNFQTCIFKFSVLQLVWEIMFLRFRLSDNIYSLSEDAIATILAEICLRIQMTWIYVLHWKCPCLHNLYLKTNFDFE